MARLEPDRLRRLAASVGVGNATRHVFLCAEQTNAKCADRETTTRIWAHLKRRVAELGLDGKHVATGDAPGLDGRCVLRSKVDCLRVCANGPIAVVYPDGVWYHSVDEAAIDRILEEHVVGGRVVEELRLRGAEEDV